MAFYQYLPPAWAHAVHVAEETDNCEIDPLGKAKNLFKFGDTPAAGTTDSLVWSLGADELDEADVTGNAIDSISSSDNGDTITMTVEGHTISGSDLTFATQTVTLTGQTRAPLTTPLHTATRVYNASGTALAGIAYVYENTALTSGKPTDTSKIHAATTARHDQTQKAKTAISSKDVYFLTDFEAHMVGNNTTARAEAWLEYRKSGGVWLPLGPTIGLGGAAQANAIHNYAIPIYVPSNAEIRVMCWASATASIAAGFNGFLAGKKSL